MGLQLHPVAIRARGRASADWISENEDRPLAQRPLAPHRILRLSCSHPPIGSFNLHPGPLPRYAGLNAPSWAIFNGETEPWSHGALDGSRDRHGADRLQSLFALQTATQACRRARDASDSACHWSPGFSRWPDRILEVDSRVAQDLEQRTYYGLGAPNDGNVCWAWSAATLERFVRASDFFPLPSPWGPPAATHGAQTLGVCSVAPTGEPCSENAGHRPCAKRGPGGGGDGRRVASARAAVGRR